MPPRHLVLIDAAVPILVGAVIVAGTLLHGGTDQLAALALGLGAAGSLWARRHAPGWTLAISGALVAVLFEVDTSVGAVAVLAPAVALYSLAVARGRTQQLLAGAAAVTAVIVSDLLHHGNPTVLQTAGHVMLVALPLLAAEVVRNHRTYLTLLQERLELSERTREQEAQRRAEHERMRIARELHDVVAHTLTAINVQAGAAAERTVGGDARDTLEQIERTSHEAIGELRAILGVLRDPEGAEVPRSPSPGVQNISELIDQARDLGEEVEVQISGQPSARMSDAVSLAAYRIVQESLTNARRHAGGIPVHVELEFDAARLSITVENATTPGSPSNGTTPGVGLAGMLERASAVGGALTAGPTSNGFRVHAQLPCELTH